MDEANRYVSTIHRAYNLWHCREKTSNGQIRSEKEADLQSIPDPVKRQARKETMEKGIEAPIVMNSLKKAGEFLDQLEANIEDSGWIAGDKFSMADACTLPYILRLDHLALSEAFSKEKDQKLTIGTKK